MRRLPNFFLQTFFVIIGISVCSCTYDNLENHPCANAPDVVTFSMDIIPILSANCSTLLCHSGSEPAANLNLEPDKAYSSLQKEGSGYINTAEPTHSVVYSQLFSISKPMPPNGKLDPCSTSLILKWLEQGAKNN
jgi:hypothetical protein